MSQLTNNKPPARLSAEAEMEMVVAQAIQIANTQLIAIRETHSYLKHKAAEYGIILTEQDLHAWSMSAWLELAKTKAHWKMPPTRFNQRVENEKKASNQSIDAEPRKTELFPRIERALEPSKALKKIRQMMEIASMGEAELLSILRESGCPEAMFAASLSSIPEETLRLCIERWETIQELAEVGRSDGGEPA